MILGQGGVVRDGLSGLEDGCDLFESCAALGRNEVDQVRGSGVGRLCTFLAAIFSQNSRFLFSPK